MNKIKTILAGVLAMMSTQAQSGELINRATNESIKFSIEEQIGPKGPIFKLIIDGTYAGFPSKEVPLEQSETFKDRLIDESDVFAGAFEYIFYKAYCLHTQELCRYRTGEKITALAVPLINIPALIGVSLDLMALPVTAPKKLVLTANAKRDLKVFSRAMVTDEKVTVTDNRFSRIKSAILNRY